jgi:HlyD family secretion protein
MAHKNRVLIALSVLVLLVIVSIYFFLTRGSDTPELKVARAVRGEIKAVINTNGIIEPADRGDVFAPIDAFVAAVQKQEGSEIEKGQLLMRLESRELRAALAEANAALLQARRQARVVTSGPPKEEVAAAESSIAECKLQLDQLKKDLQIEESLLKKQATTRMAVENLQKQLAVRQLQLESLQQKRKDLEERYSADDKAWEQDKVAELVKHVALLEQQLQMESVMAPRSGMIYSLPAKPGSYVTKGQSLAQIYQPGKIRLRAYVDEPDLGRVRKGQQALLEWDGMPGKQWQAVVDKPAGEVVALNNRSVGNVICTIEGEPKELIPNLNVKVEITTDQKADTIVIPRSALFSSGGKLAVLISEGGRTITRPVDVGLSTSEEIEILHGVNAGDSVVVNPGETGAGN